MTREEINKAMQELAEYSRLEQEITAQIETLKDSLKRAMEADGVTELLSDQGHKCYWKEQVQNRFSKTEFEKAGYGELYRQFTFPSTVKCFRFYA